MLSHDLTTLLTEFFSTTSLLSIKPQMYSDLKKPFCLDRRVGSRRYPLHPSLRLPTVRQSRQRSGEAVRLHPFGPIRLSGRVLARNFQLCEGAHHKHASAGAGASFLRRGRPRSSLVEEQEFWIGRNISGFVSCLFSKYYRIWMRFIRRFTSLRLPKVLIFCDLI